MGSNAELGEVVALLGVVTLAYLIARLVLAKLEARLLAVSGLEYILLGVLLGPVVPEFGALGDVAGLLPIIALATGWFGLLRGLELSPKTLRDAPAGSVGLAVADDLGAGAAVAAVSVLFLSSGALGPLTTTEIWMTAGVLGCAAAVGSTEPIDVIKRRYHVEGKTVPLLRRAARLGDALAILLFGTLFCIFHRDQTAAPLGELIGRPLSWFEWTGLYVGGLGVGLGLLFRLFLGNGGSDKTLLVALIGIITFASGAAWMLELSPLAVNLVLGFVLANAASIGGQVRATLERTQRPMTLVLLIFAGALWTPPPQVSQALAAVRATSELGPAIAATLSALVLWLIAPALALAAARALGKALASRWTAIGSDRRPDLFRGLLGQGDVTIAMAISFRLVYDGAAVSFAYSAVLGSVVLHDLFAPRILRALLVDAGELHPAR